MDLKPYRVSSRTSVLPNGLRVVHHEDRTVPLAAVHLMYRVGSADEAPGRTGTAHLLEHLLFEGSEHCQRGEADLLIEQAGGTSNGSTWLDRTTYHAAVPVHALELAFWLERERLVHTLPLLDGPRLEVQRGVVINERLQSVENQPYGRAEERLFELLFPHGHPYSWPTIGYLADLERITLEEVRSFFTRYYTPANAVLVVAGDVPRAVALELAERYFGDLRGVRQPTAPPAESGLAPPAAVRDTLEDRVSFPRLYIGHVVPAYGTRDWSALDVLSYLLTDGESSRLQRALVRNAQLAQEIDAYLLPTGRAAVLGLVATARSGVEPDALEHAYRAELRQLVAGGVTAEELRGAVRRIRRDQLAGLEQLDERAEALAHAATLLGEAAALNDVIASYLDVSAEDVIRVASDFLEHGRGATLSVLPGERPPNGVGEA